jgi:RNA polymerase sigma-70 factor (ECF subfamily)
METPYTEQDLLRKVAEGDESAFAQLFHTYHQELAGYIFSLTKSLPLAEEILQDTFVKIWIQRDRLASITSFRSWLFIVSRNHAFNSLRSLAREAQQQQQWVLANKEDTHGGDDPDHQFYYTLIEEAVHQLPPQQQKAYLLSRQKGLRHEEIARQLELSRETVKRHISLALRSIVSYVRMHASKVLLGFTALISGM